MNARRARTKQQSRARQQYAKPTQVLLTPVQVREIRASLTAALAYIATVRADVEDRPGMTTRNPVFVAVSDLSPLVQSVLDTVAAAAVTDPLPQSPVARF